MGVWKTPSLEFRNEMGICFPEVVRDTEGGAENYACGFPFP
jgi:hypothetical protein